MPMPDGLYDQVLTDTLNALVARSTGEAQGPRLGQTEAHRRRLRCMLMTLITSEAGDQE